LQLAIVWDTESCIIHTLIQLQLLTTGSALVKGCSAVNSEICSSNDRQHSSH